jgi:RNA 3'-terminal phosphate cyclase (ATP)
MVHVRAGRPKPGLANQHVTAIRAAQQISRAKVSGATVGSKQFTFEPGVVQPGTYSFDVGTAGSTTLVLQTIALPLALANGNSTVTIIGGTHNPMAPCYEYLESVWAPLLALVGVHIYLQIKRAGFYPAGGGTIEANIMGTGDATADRLPSTDYHSRSTADADTPPVLTPSSHLCPITILERGEIDSIDGFSAVARLPLSIAERQAKRAELKLATAGLTHHPINCQSINAVSPGTVLFLNCRCRGAPAAFFGLGARGKPAERVADEAVDQLVEHFSKPGAIDPHAADQLVLPLALAPGRATFTTTKVTDHLVTHAELLRQFIDRRIEVSGAVETAGTVQIH